MKSIEIEKQRETKLKAARLEAGFYNIIGGQRAVATSQLSVINPATGEELATVPNIVAITLDDAVAAARNAFLSWHTVPLERRKEAVAECHSCTVGPESIKGSDSADTLKKAV